MTALAVLGKTLLMMAALGMVVWLLFSRTRNPSRNVLIVVIMSFMLTLIAWLAALGAGFLLRGGAGFAVSAEVLIVLLLIALISVLAILGRGQVPRVAGGVVLVAGAGVLLLASYLAAIGVAQVTDSCARTRAMSWVIVSLGVTAAVEVLLLVQTRRAQGGSDAPEPRVPGEDHPGRQDLLR